MVRWHLDFTKFNFGRGSAPDPAVGAYDVSPDLLVGWGKAYLIPIPHPLDAKGASSLDAKDVESSVPSAPSAPSLSEPSSCQKLAPRLVIELRV